MGIEPTSNPWQGLIITDILYLHKLVGRERLELPVFLVLRVYSPLPSPLGIPSQINDHQSLSTLVPCYLVVWVGDMFAFLSPLEPLKLYEGVVQGA